MYLKHNSRVESNYMLVSVVHDNQLCYPDSSEFFSPSELYSEYPFDHIASRPNLVYQAIRNCLAQALLDADNFGTPSWNPFGQFIKRGDKVFILCNFVYHRTPWETSEDFFAKCTHASILRVLIDYIYIATGPNGTIYSAMLLYNHASREQVLEDTGASNLLRFYKQNAIKV